MEFLKLNRELKEMDEIVNHVRDLTNEKFLPTRRTICDMYLSFLPKLNKSEKIEEFEKKIRKDDEILELLFDDTVALCRSVWSDTETVYFCVGIDDKRRPDTVSETKEQAIVYYILCKNQRTAYTDAVFELMKLF